MPVSEGLTSDQFVCTDAETFSSYVRIFDEENFLDMLQPMSHKCNHNCELVGIEQALNQGLNSSPTFPDRQSISIPFFLQQKASFQLIAMKRLESLTREFYPEVRKILIRVWQTSMRLLPNTRAGKKSLKSARS
jgi:hypothetical protein